MSSSVPSLERRRRSPLGASAMMSSSVSPLILLALLAASSRDDGSLHSFPFPPLASAASDASEGAGRVLDSSSSSDDGPRNIYKAIRHHPNDKHSFDLTLDVDLSGAFRFDGLKTISKPLRDDGKKESKFGFVKMIGAMRESKRKDYKNAIKTKKRGKLSGAITESLVDDDLMAFRLFEDEPELTFVRHDVPGRKIVRGPRDGGFGGGGGSGNVTDKSGWTGIYRPDNASDPVLMNVVQHPVTGGVCGSFVRDGLNYNLKTLPDGTMDVNVIDVADYQPGNPPLSVPGGTRRLTSRDLRELLRRRIESTNSTGPDDLGSNIDVMVVYSRRAMCVEAELDYPCDPTTQNMAPIELLIDLAFYETNTAFANSGIDTVLRNVRTYMHPTLDENAAGYTFDTMLTALREPNDGIMDDVHEERESAGADLVSLFVEDSTSEADGCGLAYQYANDRSGGFSLVKRECATGEMIFGHELGHNFGCLHNKDDDHTNANGATSHGYQDPSSEFRTIMAYNCDDRTCPPIPYYSNPTSTYDGSAVGDATHDCAGQINSVTPIIAAFESIADYDPTAAPTDAPSSAPTKSERPSSSFAPSQSPTATSQPTEIPVIKWPLCYKHCKVQR